MFSAAQQLYFSEQLLLNENGLARQAMSWLSSGLPRLPPCGLLRLTRARKRQNEHELCRNQRIRRDCTRATQLRSATCVPNGSGYQPIGEAQLSRLGLHKQASCMRVCGVYCQTVLGRVSQRRGRNFLSRGNFRKKQGQLAS